MPSATAAVGLRSAGGPFERMTIERRDLRERDVLIDIAFCGICHSDIHQARDEWGGSTYPMVPGHEITGTVAAVGPAVTAFSVGDRVGVGCFVDSCETCEHCQAGEEQFCVSGPVSSYNAREYDGERTFGGYSRQIVVKDRFVVAIPAGLGLREAAPLLCAGITTFTPLKRWSVGPGTRVAVIGMGGLGHVAVQLAAAMGAEVTVLSRTAGKREDSLRLGAARYAVTAEEGVLAELASSFDFILNTVSANIDVDAYLSLLRVDGTLCTVGAPPKADSVHAYSLIAGRRSLAGSVVGGLRATQEMLVFCAAHGVVPQIESIGVDEIGEAYERVVRSDVRYRFVIDLATLGR